MFGAYLRVRFISQLTHHVKLPVNANISEIDGAYYSVHLEWVPRIGELIDLYSYIEEGLHRTAKRYYEVIQIVHQLQEIDEKVIHAHHCAGAPRAGGDERQFRELETQGQIKKSLGTIVPRLFEFSILALDPITGVKRSHQARDGPSTAY